jgi:hypothetical protein
MGFEPGSALSECRSSGSRASPRREATLNSLTLMWLWQQYDFCLRHAAIFLLHCGQKGGRYSYDSMGLA